MNASVLAARGITRELGTKVKTRVLHGIDIRVERGDFVALTGHSGSGKSTLLYILGILDAPTGGEVWIEDVNTTRLDDGARAAIRNQKLGFVFQFHFLLGDFTVVENVMIPMLRRGLPNAVARRKAIATLDTLQLGELQKRRPNELSGGQQQRVAIARAVANEPLILFADEPTGNLDSTNGRIVMDMLTELNKSRGLTVLMVTHDETFAEAASRRVSMRDGRIIGDERADG